MSEGEHGDSDSGLVQGPTGQRARRHHRRAEIVVTAAPRNVLGHVNSQNTRQRNQQTKRAVAALSTLDHIAPNTTSPDQQVQSCIKQAFSLNTQAAHNYLKGVGKQPEDLASKALVCAAVLEAQLQGFHAMSRPTLSAESSASSSSMSFRCA